MVTSWEILHLSRPVAASGCSVIDYSIFSEDILDRVDHMIVGAPNAFSDHAMISLQLNTPSKPEQIKFRTKLNIGGMERDQISDIRPPKNQISDPRKSTK